MTQELPKRAKDADPVFCTECNTAVRLERGRMNSLQIRCACGNDMSVRVAGVLPDGWQP